MMNDYTNQDHLVKEPFNASRGNHLTFKYDGENYRYEPAKPPRKVTWKITSFRGSFGGMHWYGSLNVRSLGMINIDTGTRSEISGPIDKHKPKEAQGIKIELTWEPSRSTKDMSGELLLQSPSQTTSTRFDNIHTLIETIQSEYAKIFGDERGWRLIQDNLNGDYGDGLKQWYYDETNEPLNEEHATEIANCNHTQHFRLQEYYHGIPPENICKACGYKEKYTEKE